MAFFAYVDEVNTNLICCICHSPFFQPVVTTTCFHTFCRTCIETSLEQHACCPIDRSVLTQEELRPENLLLRNMVDELLVECSNKLLGCTATCQRQLLELHKRESCPYTSVPCSEANCDQTLMRKDLGKHEEICKSREDTCELCGTLVKSIDMQLHNNKCLEQETICSICGQTMKRSEMKRHSEKCPKADVRCDHCLRGCSWIGERQHQPSHLGSCPYESIKGFFGVLDERFGTLREENSLLRHRLENTESTVRSLQTQLVRIRHSLGRWCSTDAEDDISGLADRVSEMNLQTATDEVSISFDIPRWRANNNPLAPIVSFSPEASPISSTHEIANATDGTNPMNQNQTTFAQIAQFFPPTISVSVSNHSSISVDGEEPGSIMPLPLPPPPPSASSTPSSHMQQMDPNNGISNFVRFPFVATRPSLAFPPPPIRFPDVTNPRTNNSGVSSVHQHQQHQHRQQQHQRRQQQQQQNGNATAGGMPNGTVNSHASRVLSLDRSSTIEGALTALQRSVSSVSSALDALARRTDVGLTTENLRMNEEVGALRAIVHGLRMQVHALLSERNINAGVGVGGGGGGGGGGGSWIGVGSGLPFLTTTTATYLNHPPPPQHVPLVINSTSTTSTTKL